MRNRENSKIGKIIEVTKRLPVFTLDDLASVETNKKYLRVVLARNVKTGILVRLKKGSYVAKDYLNNLEKTGRMHTYAEFLAGILYKPSYLSLEYILHQHNVITESPVVVTAVALKKTASFATIFGKYNYHSVAPSLFNGFSSKRDGDYIIFRASLAKSLFDFLYFRKNQLTNEDSIKELRLNLEVLKNSDKKELAWYVALEGSRRMKNIHKILWKK